MLHTPVTPDTLLHSLSLVPLTYQTEAQSPNLPLSILPVTDRRASAHLANPGGMCISKLCDITSLEGDTLSSSWTCELFLFPSSA